jgi:hypothetical protein
LVEKNDTFIFSKIRETRKRRKNFFFWPVTNEITRIINKTELFKGKKSNNFLHS